jgi:GMP synthase (glutamine-hydrolysing)
MSHPRVLVVETQALVPIGSLRPVLRDAGIKLITWRPAQLPPPTTLEGISGLIALGGAANPDQDEQHPWLRAERDLLSHALERNVPTVGICLGAELLAQVIGARMVRLSEPEIGWRDLMLEPDAAGDPLCSQSSQHVLAFQWHSYGFDCPPGATVLSRTEAGTPVFRWNDLAWGFQFHMEANKTIVASWIRRYRDELRAHGIDHAQLRVQTELRDARYVRQAVRIGQRFSRLVKAYARGQRRAAYGVTA